MSKVLVTGCGRSGTMFVSEVLKRSGVNASHEKYFDIDVHSWPESSSGVEVSWLAAPYLDELPKDVRVVHLVRHPLDVVRSFLGIRFFERSEGSEFLGFVLDHCWDVGHEGPIDQALGYWLRWNKMISPFSEVRVRVETMEPIVLYYLFEQFGIEVSRQRLEESCVELGTRHNGRDRADTTSSEILDRPLGKKVQRLAGVYGYKL